MVTGLVRTICGGGKLAAGGETVCHEALEEDWVQVCAGKIDCSGVTGGARAYDDLGMDELGVICQWWKGYRWDARLWNAALCSWELCHL